MISPTVGRKVWYSPQVEQGECRNRLSADQYFDATVIFVHSDRCVNLKITDHRGQMFSKEYVPLLQEGDAPNPHGGHCLWMPYQVGQSKPAKEPDIEGLNKHVVESVGTRLMDLNDLIKTMEAAAREPAIPPSTGRES